MCVFVWAAVRSVGKHHDLLQRSVFRTKIVWRLKSGRTKLRQQIPFRNGKCLHYNCACNDLAILRTCVTTPPTTNLLTCTFAVITPGRVCDAPFNCACNDLAILRMCAATPPTTNLLTCTFAVITPGSSPYQKSTSQDESLALVPVQHLPQPPEPFGLNELGKRAHGAKVSNRCDCVLALHISMNAPRLATNMTVLTLNIFMTAPRVATGVPVCLT